MREPRHRPEARLSARDAFVTAPRTDGSIACCNPAGPSAADGVGSETLTDERKLLTDEELADIEARLGRGHVAEADGDRLMAEVKRLRSDAWLERAAVEIAAVREFYATCSAPLAARRLLDRLRCHRNGKA